MRHPDGRTVAVPVHGRQDLIKGTMCGILATIGMTRTTSYTKWDRDAYIERVGGPEEAERRRKVLMARQSGQRLAGDRKQRGHTQAPATSGHSAGA